MNAPKNAFDGKSWKEIADMIETLKKDIAKAVYKETGIPEHILFATSEEKSPNGINNNVTE